MSAGGIHRHEFRFSPCAREASGAVLKPLSVPRRLGPPAREF